MKHGKEIDLVEISANWYVDDLPPMMFIKSAPNSHGFVNPRDVEQCGATSSTGSIASSTTPSSRTIHPDVSGRPQVLLMLERFIEYVNAHAGVKWMTFEAIAEDFRKRFPFARRQAAGRDLMCFPSRVLRLSRRSRPLDRGWGGGDVGPVSRPLPPFAGAAGGASRLWSQRA